MKFDKDSNRLTDLGSLPNIALLIGVIGAVLSGIGAWNNSTQFFHSYLTSFVFWAAISLGALFFTMVHHLVDAHWSIVIRRISECIMGNLPWLFIAFIPILLLVGKYEWAPINAAVDGHGDAPAAHAVADDHSEQAVAVADHDDHAGNDVHAEHAKHGDDASTGDHSERDGAYGGHDHDPHAAHHALVQKKKAYLNVPFFQLRSIIYFLVWSVLSFLLYSRSVAQDTNPSPNFGAKIRPICAIGMVLFALTITYAAYDWMMSLEAAWFSTIFGLCYFAAAFLSMMCFTALVVVYLRRKGILADTITIEHYHDIGKWMFAFTIFWTYVSFSQYFLIWYGTLPEDTFWYHVRWADGWKCWSQLLILGHFIVPFFFLLSREPKRNPFALAAAAIWILIFHWVEMYWQVAPALRHHVTDVTTTASLSWQDAATFAAIGGFFVYLFWKRLAKHPLIPVGDAKLDKSIRFTNI